MTVGQNNKTDAKTSSYLFLDNTNVLTLDKLRNQYLVE